MRAIRRIGEGTVIQVGEKGRWVDLQARRSSKGWIGTDRDRIVTP